MRSWLLLAGFILWNQHVVHSQQADFSVTVVGSKQEQQHFFSDSQAKLDKGLAVIKIPTESKSKHLEEDTPSIHCIYVVLRNVSPKTIRLDANQSDWFNCIEFKVTSENGKVFSIHRPVSQAWFGNGVESWVFQPNGIRVISVDFTTGSWEGFPSDAELSRSHPFKIQAVFNLNHFTDSTQSSKSPEVQAEQGNY